MPALGSDLVSYREQMTGMWNDADNNKQFIGLHSSDSEGGNSNVFGYLERNWGTGSYQTMVDFDGEEVRIVPDNKQAWGAMPQGNSRGLHTCVMGRAGWSRDRWMQEGKMLERTAMRYAEWSKLYDIPLVKITSHQARAGERGIVGHADISDAWDESDHWDPGPDFPFDVVIERAKEILNSGENDMANADEVMVQFMGVDNSGWTELRPFPNNQGETYSVFKARNLAAGEGQTMVEALATLVFEATLRIPAYQGENLDELGPETVLGHAAAAHGAVLDLIELVKSLAADVAALKEGK